MPKVTMWKCPFTGKLFETRRKYINHLKKLRARRTMRRRQLKLEREARANMDAKIAALRTAADIEKFIVEDFHDILLATYGRKKFAIIKQMNIEFFEFERIRYNERESNSHNCPRNGVTNWGGYNDKKGAPRGYPGFGGQVKWKVTGPKRADHGSFDSRIEMDRALKYIGVHVGTGCPGWDGNISFQFFVDDFPGIKEEVEIAREEAKRAIFQSRLKGKPIIEKVIIQEHIRPIANTQKEVDNNGNTVYI